MTAAGDKASGGVVLGGQGVVGISTNDDVQSEKVEIVCLRDGGLVRTAGTDLGIRGKCHICQDFSYSPTECNFFAPVVLALFYF